MKICVIIPTFNEAKEIGKLIVGIKPYALEILVIDDGSTDNTHAIARESGAIVLKNISNAGKGAALIRGFHYMLDNRFDAAITLDGDGQHLPEDIALFLRLAENPEFGMLVGNRIENAKNMPIVRLLTNKFMSWILSKATGQKIPDSQCGFRLIKAKVLEKINLTTSRYDTESEILLQAARLGYKIGAVPIKSIYRGEKSKINPFVDTPRFIRLMLRTIWITPP
ncbi:MAG: glycosyltransferase family 2 protein [Candidatus Omnitrophota bacterium]